MVSWKKIYSKGKVAEKRFVLYCNKHRQLCVKSNDLLYFLLERRTPPYPAYNSKKYLQKIKKVARKLTTKTLRFLRRLAREKGIYWAKEKPRPEREKRAIKKFIEMGALKYFNFKNDFVDVFVVPGMPDFAVYNKDKKEVYFAEVKASKSTVTPVQRKLMKKMKRNNIDVIVVYTNEVNDWLEVNVIS